MIHAIEQLAQEVGELLANSSIDKKIKDAILEDLDTMSEQAVFQLKDILEREKEKADSITGELEAFMAKQDQKWADLAVQQKKLADDIGDQLFDKLKDTI